MSVRIILYKHTENERKKIIKLVKNFLYRNDHCQKKTKKKNGLHKFFKKYNMKNNVQKKKRSYKQNFRHFDTNLNIRYY